MNDSALWLVLHKMKVPFLAIVISYTISIVGLLLIDGVDSYGNIYHMSIFDAFYFVTYTASTIGFGEYPFEFTYQQRLWVSAMIYVSVVSWFYAIGTLISLLQDKLFISQIKQYRFKKQVGKLKQKFIIVLGYNYITSEIIKIINDSDFRVVVIENDKDKVDNLILENFTPHVPVLRANSYDSQNLELSGVKSMFCKALVTLYKDDELNLRIAVAAKMLNSNIIIAAKSTTKNHTENLKDLDVEIVENPFKIIASQINLALMAPNILKLERWIYQIGKLNDSLPTLPQGRYIICGFGRFGQEIYKVFKANNIKAVFIEIKETKKRANKDIIFGNSDDKHILKDAGIDKSVAIIAGTQDDTTNISILRTAKKLNKDIVTIARENHIEDFSIFKNADIDEIFMPSKILINKTTNALIKPSADKFIKYMRTQDEEWGQSLVKKLVQDIDENPSIYLLHLVEKRAIAILNKLKTTTLKLSIFKTSLSNNNLANNIIVLMIYNSSTKKEIVLPPWDTNIEKDDKILFACDDYSINEIEYIANNVFELHYAMTGQEKRYLSFKF
ncbi:MAG: potassium transporter TrkA [Epsilonproteobacteria bacterium]|nr:MAG: potassium transporter TrkA [Campylobacterota bacterium]